MKTISLSVCITVFLFLLGGCKAKEASGIEYEILYKVQRTKKDYYELPYEMENVITYISSYEVFQESFSEGRTFG